ncbi:hypothetical protein FB45DRAFT_285459 [Roridomyces roridus]|uniref:Yeast cell wall synthesis Kre9/Knh1-like N-terminal domain-containing protein n=1 Tax=Roridomyces roridus TaxID=1738132 RepID=A0AAD7CAY8_9AGAR|nr:hypothetical protein FB45DRAFT_285459 [Roridomyces roridus]
MFSTSSLTLFFLALVATFSLVAAAPTPLSRDVFIPPVLSPGKGAVWHVGERYNVTWDVSKPPKQITNREGMIVLVNKGLMIDLEHPLAEKFDIMTGSHEVEVPDVKPGTDYQILVFGDSGNTGEMFEILPRKTQNSIDTTTTDS